jgi:predicted nucleic acid-binding Zn ribbon protein
VSVARARRQPRKLGDALTAAVEPMAPATLLGAVQSAWPKAVGERVAAEATPVSERDGVVTVACRSASWAQELDLLAGEIASKLRSELPAGAQLQALRFSVAEPPD